MVTPFASLTDCSAACRNRPSLKRLTTRELFCVGVHEESIGAFGEQLLSLKTGPEVVQHDLADLFLREESTWLDSSSLESFRVNQERGDSEWSERAAGERVLPLRCWRSRSSGEPSELSVVASSLLPLEPAVDWGLVMGLVWESGLDTPVPRSSSVLAPVCESTQKRVSAEERPPASV